MRGLAMRVFVDEPLVAAASEGHPLFAAYGGAAAVPVAALAEYPLISLARGLGVAVLPGPDPGFGLRTLRIDDPRARGRPAHGGAPRRGRCWCGCRRR
ncbi:hypothetical protein [Streptomyces lincolnensis]|uniref:hypothetical protein n=1 Tax=Streptomyces lincolnensis TaxID=1915 RepID=UPI0037CCDD93